MQPATIREVNHPAEYAQITRDVLVQEARIEEIPIAEERDTYRVEVLDQHATVDSHAVPVETQTITRYSLRTEERWEWRLVDCNEINIPGHNPPMSSEVQPMASRQTAPSSQANTYLYGTEMPVDNSVYSEEVPVAQASYSSSSESRSSRSTRRSRR